jgi:RsiW-degrading membrane proteinase PrsW (M82 family)
VALIAIVILSATKRARNVAVLLLVFVQPLLILYFIYWRYNRNYASLDYVIKLFAVGFWFTTFQSVVIEGILQVFIMIFIFFLNATVIASGSMGWIFAPLGPHTMAQRLVAPLYEHIFIAAAATEAEGSSSTSSEDAPPHPLVFLAYTFLTAFLLAAGTEETMKHFVVRCCQFPGPLRSPQAVMVYLLAGALGFATSENIEYVFGMTNAKGGSVSAMEEQLIILAMRVLMPVHLICAVLQAVELSKVRKHAYIYIYVYVTYS